MCLGEAEGRGYKEWNKTSNPRYQQVPMNHSSLSHHYWLHESTEDSNYEIKTQSLYKILSDNQPVYIQWMPHERLRLRPPKRDSSLQNQSFSRSKSWSFRVFIWKIKKSAIIIINIIFVFNWMRMSTAVKLFGVQRLPETKVIIFVLQTSAEQTDGQRRGPGCGWEGGQTRCRRLPEPLPRCAWQQRFANYGGSCLCPAVDVASVQSRGCIHCIYCLQKCWIHYKHSFLLPSLPVSPQLFSLVDKTPSPKTPLKIVTIETDFVSVGSVFWRWDVHLLIRTGAFQERACSVTIVSER